MYRERGIITGDADVYGDIREVNKGARLYLELLQIEIILFGKLISFVYKYCIGI